MTSNIWTAPEDYIESRVINESVSAFALLSDGVESASFEHSIINPKTGKWSDPNKPYVKFFEPLYSKLLAKWETNPDPEEIKLGWEKFLRGEGNNKLEIEKDDKTLIFGVLT